MLDGTARKTRQLNILSGFFCCPPRFRTLAASILTVRRSPPAFTSRRASTDAARTPRSCDSAASATSPAHPSDTSIAQLAGIELGNIFGEIGGVQHGWDDANIDEARLSWTPPVARLTHIESRRHRPSDARVIPAPAPDSVSGQVVASGNVANRGVRVAAGLKYLGLELRRKPPATGWGWRVHLRCPSVEVSFR